MMHWRYVPYGTGYPNFYRYDLQNNGRYTFLYSRNVNKTIQHSTDRTRHHTHNKRLSEFAFDLQNLKLKQGHKQEVIKRTMATRTYIVLAVLLVNICQCAGRYRKDGNPMSRNIVVQNRAGCKIDFFWIHPHTKELAGSNTDGGLVNGGDSTINSYITHSFEVQELPGKKSGKCKEAECRKAYFTVSANEDQSKSLSAALTRTRHSCMHV